MNAAKTDASGTYVLTDEPPGDYVIKVSLANCQDEMRDVSVSTKIISTENFVLLTIFGSIEGTITGANNASGPTTVICLIDSRRRIAAVADADAEEKFQFSNVLAGCYEIEFQHPRYAPQEIGFMIVAGKTISFQYDVTSGWMHPMIVTTDPQIPIGWCGCVHLRGADENNIWGSPSLSHPDYETTAPAYGTAVLIR